MTWLWVCLGAAVGAPVRYLTDRLIQSHHDSLFPWGTLAVNLIGSFVLGGLVGAATHRDVPAPLFVGVGIGFCGALTTYSSLGYETIRLVEDGARLYAAVNLAVSLGAGLAAAASGYALGQVV